MKTNTHEEISFTNCHAGIYLSKSEGAVAVDFKSSEMVLYLNTSLYQALAWLLYSASETKEVMDYVNWAINPKSANKNTLIELHGPEHVACLICSPNHERVQLNLEIGVSIDLKFSDFKGLIELILEAQSDLEWRRQLLQWAIVNDIGDNHKDSKDKKAI
ncbi:MAG: hypothetical protein A3I68_00420 [Candidatus Melainabacteria bacterium RIFCSPLOWO2_02_FULL_35_15]|nr:MAG: hypothetical protein A3F80_06505 [Candidatus Melainabacteria bacterium RIFCSPLOWO2_12_FULL_35_11]OGI13729.1 MAG: hypothetical protein A3I68_00420 [Candidatus Melainabacteria bacterium RIFCSPLOWO2_02_FULL_35_15]